MKYTATAPLAYRSRRKGGRSLAAYGFPTIRTITRQGSTRTDAYTYNNRSELIGDVVDGTGLNGWDYDNIGNRRMEHRSDGYEVYTANNLNQYTAIEDSEGTFTPTYDADGNQTRVKTSTGIWNVTYNAKNRPVLFSKDDNSVSVECTYDYMGRRATKKVTENGTVTLHQRYLYRGYLQIACCDLLRSNEPCLWLITWDPTQPIATRPLAIQKDGTWYTYGWDLTKNVWEAYTTTGYIGTAYTYTAYGQVTTNGAVEQPIQWSSEYNDTELGLVYYNYRYYNYCSGNWSSRDIAANDEYNLYLYIRNRSIDRWDAYGLFLDFLKNANWQLPSFTYEVSSPIPVWGGYPFGAVEIKASNPDCSQEISIAVGITWSASKLVSKFIPKKIADRVPEFKISGFLEGKGSYKCGCFDFCEISLGVAGSFGEGRRDGSQSRHKNRLEVGIGGSIEIRGTVDLCRGEIKGTWHFVFTAGLKTSEFSVFGYKFNPSFDINFEQEKYFANISVPELKVFKPCS